jgi:hypothetical protein
MNEVCSPMKGKTRMSRAFALLDTTIIDAENHLLTLRGSETGTLTPEISIRREGVWLLIAAGVGFVEVALRLSFEEMHHVLSSLQPNDGLTTTRQVGTGEAYLGVGLKQDGTLILRPIVVGDATGHVRMNFRLTSDARAALLRWIAEAK